MFMPHNTQRASKRGYAVRPRRPASRTGHEPPQTILIKWASDDLAREMETIEREREEYLVPRYGNGRGDDCLEGEVATPAVLIEHATAVAPEPAVAEVEAESAPPPPEPEPAAVRYQRDRIAAWIRARLIPWSLNSCLHCRKPIIAGQDWQEASNGEARARFHRTCHAEWRTEREAAARHALGLGG